MTRPRGQIAVGFLVIAAFTLLLVRMTINLGQMAQVRTETSNAADAGALAAASWIASGQNEAALIAGRMLDLLGMVQAIYIVPFCPGEEAQDYANRLWASLYGTPAFFAVATGPVMYLQDVADAAMISAWNVGRREFFTAAINNMILRYASSPVGYMGDGGIGLDPDGSLPKEIQRRQDALYDDGIVTSTALAWNNGLPFTDPKHLNHSAQFLSDYPHDPPTLNMVCNEWSRAPYHQYRPRQTIPIWPSSFFDCDFVGLGITDTEATGPLVNLGKVPNLPDKNPLAVDAEGSKEWEKIDFAPAIPSFEHTDLSMRVRVGECSQHVCGIEPRKTACAPVLPLNITRGAGVVEVTVSHEVTRPNGFVGGLFGAIPDWEPEFERVESTAFGQYSAASTFPPSPDAKATLGP